MQILKTKNWISKYWHKLDFKMVAQTQEPTQSQNSTKYFKKYCRQVIEAKANEKSRTECGK